MRKFGLVALVLVAVSAFMAVMVASASALNLLWLVNGVAFEGTLSAETEGDLFLIRLNGSGGVRNEFLCEGILDGTITNPATPEEGSDQVTKVLNLAQEEIAEDGLAGGLALECITTFKNANEAAACEVNVKVLVWPANLPWSTLLELMEPSGQWLDLLFGPVGKEPGYELECPKSLFLIGAAELCEGNTSALVLEVLESWPGTVALGAHIEFNSESEEGKCEGQAELVAGLGGLGVLWAIEGSLNRLETDVSEL
jgi:hypothetical protein